MSYKSQFTYLFNLYDILFFIKSIQNPSGSFDIMNYVNFYQYSILSTNKQSNFYFNRLPRLYNALPVLDLNQLFTTIKSYLKQFFWNHFKSHLIQTTHIAFTLFARAPSVQRLHVHLTSVKNFD